MPAKHGLEEERDKWLTTDYRPCRDPLCTPVQPKRHRHAPEPAPPAYGRYGALRDKGPEEDMECDIKGPDGDPMGDFGISPPPESPARAAGNARRRRSTWNAYAEDSLEDRTWRNRGAAP